MSVQAYLALSLGAEASLGLIVGTLLVSYVRGHQRPPYARYLAFAWFAAGAAHGLSLAAFLLSIVQNTGAWRVALSGLGGVASLWSAALLVLAAIALTDREIAPSTVRKVLLGAGFLGVATTVIGIWPELGTTARYRLRVSTRDLLVAIGHVAVGLVMFWKYRRSLAARLFGAASLCLATITSAIAVWELVSRARTNAFYPFLSEGIEVGIMVLCAVTLLGWYVQQSQEEVIRAHDAASARVRHSEQQFLRLIQGGTDVIAVLGEDRHFAFVSPAVRDVLGWDPQSLLGASPRDFIHAEDFAAVELKVVESFKDEGTFLQTFRFRHGDGTWRTLEGAGHFDRDVNGRPLTVINARDVTEREGMRQRLAQSNKMESIGRLAGGVAHDFNNLLTGILASAEMAKESLPLGTPALLDLDDVTAGARRASDLTRQLLTFARQDDMRQRPLELNAVVSDLATMLRRLVEERIRLSIEPDSSDLWVMADRSQLEQIIVNLAVNARDAMPAGGSLSIRTFRLPPDQQDDGRYEVGLAVSDTGLGMSEEIKKRLFEPFFTTKGTGRGTGLGLAVCYGIVTRHGGAIDVESTLGKGTTFRVRLPATSPGVAEDSSAKADVRARGQGELLLLVEDDLGVRAVTARALERAGYRVEVATDGIDALRQLDRIAPELALVVSDVVMPDMGGAELGAALRARLPDLPIILTTGYPGDQVIRTQLRELNAPLLQKPYAMQELLRTIRSQLNAIPVSGALPR